jgi:hypothetical protein
VLPTPSKTHHLLLDGLEKTGFYPPYNSNCDRHASSTPEKKAAKILPMNQNHVLFSIC